MPYKALQQGILPDGLDSKGDILTIYYNQQWSTNITMRKSLFALHLQTVC